MDAARKGTWTLGLLLLAAVVGAGLLVGPDRIQGWMHALYDVRGLIQWGGYVALGLIVFAETGLLVGFFLPGDSLLVMAGVFAAPTSDGHAGLLDVGVLFALLIPLAILGDAVNYSLGRRTGPAIFRREDGLLFKKANLVRAQRFYERHGGKTIILARFVPIVRTYAPFVAGIGAMPYARYLAYCVAGALIWVVSLCAAGYFFGNIPMVRKNLTVVILLIVLLSISPGILAYLRNQYLVKRQG